ncbi:MAG: hypothetical protein GXY88_08155 [Tissierellia bacterium]|nr:hypothetical protein [Tissierellia bacterium]
MNKDLVFKIIRRTLIASLFILGIFLLLFPNPKPIVSGFIFGTIISILAFKLLHNTVNKSVLMTPSRARAYTIAHYMGRFAMYFVVLMLAAIANYLNFAATAVGLVMVRIVITGSLFFDKDFLKK